MPLSACWIVKNEAEVLARSIESVIEAVDDIVIVDTGSTDDTIAVAERYGAQIHHFTWINDFSAARNYAMSLTRHKNVIFLDADEWFSPKLTQEDAEHYCAALDNDPLAGIMLSPIHHLDTHGRVFEKTTTGRILVKRDELAYLNAVHEAYLYKDRSGRSLKAILADGHVILHTGYSQAAKQGKLNRNIELLKLELQEEQQPTQRTLTLMYLAREHLGQGEADEALLYVRQLLKKNRYLHDVRQSMAVSAIFFQMSYTLYQISGKVSGQQIKSDYYGLVAKLFPTHPGTPLLEPYCDIYFGAADDGALLQDIDATMQRSKALGSSTETTHEAIESALYGFAAVAAFRRGDMLRALDLAYNALSKRNYSRMLFFIVLSAIKGQPPAEIVAFLNQVIGIDEKGKLEALMEFTRLMDCLPVHVYYINKYRQAYGTSEVTEIGMLLYSRRYGDALNAACKIMVENTVDTTHYVLICALCMGTPDTVEKYAEAMPPFVRVARAYHTGERLEDLTAQEKSVFPAAYQAIALTEGLEKADRFARAYSGQPLFVYLHRTAFLEENGLFEEALAGLPPEADLTDMTVCQHVFAPQVHCGRYREAFGHIRYFMAEKEMTEPALFSYLSAIADKADEPLASEARALFDRHTDYKELLTTLGDVVKFGYAQDDYPAAAAKKLRGLSKEEFTALGRDEDGGRFITAALCDACERAAAVYEQKRMYGMAMRCLRLNYFADYHVVESTQGLARIFRAVHNVRLARWFEEQLADAKGLSARFKEASLEPPVVEARFCEILRFARETPPDAIAERMKDNFAKSSKAYQDSVTQYVAQYTFWGALQASQGNYGLFENRARELSAHWQDFAWLYDKLEDMTSRRILYAVLSSWLDMNTQALLAVKEPLFKDYFDKTLIQCDEDEVFVDLGTYTGDTVTDYIHEYGLAYKKIYCYEILQKNIDIMTENLKKYKNIEFRKRGASDTEGKMYLSEHSDSSAGMLSEEGEAEIETVTIDRDVPEPITFIKMDIEGGEQRALRGCAEQIKANKPKLAISVYHSNEDYWKIARIIDEICPGYRFYLRSHSGNRFPSEITLIALYGK